MRKHFEKQFHGMMLEIHYDHVLWAVCNCSGLNLQTPPVIIKMS